MEDIISRVLDKLNFYEITLVGEGFGEMVICTYRPEESVADIFIKLKESDDIDFEIWETTLEKIRESGQGYFPIFCVELNQDYNSLKDLAEDLMVFRLSGLIDKEMKGM